MNDVLAGYVLTPKLERLLRSIHDSAVDEAALLVRVRDNSVTREHDVYIEARITTLRNRAMQALVAIDNLRERGFDDSGKTLTVAPTVTIL